MEIQFLKYRHWINAYRCSLGAAELVVVADIGPRILSLRWHGGANLLYEDGSDFGVGDWRLYGGHRFTVAPEGGETYAPDNAPCTAGNGAESLRIAGPLAANGTRRVLIISAAPDGVGFDLCHVLENHGPRVWSGALWAITCMPPSRIVGPRAGGEVRFWPGTNRGEWMVAPDHVASVSNDTRGKIGWHTEAAWLASLQAHATVVIHSPNPPPARQCVDEGCNVEIFSCAKYVELETLGGAITIPPGGQASHGQRWRLLEPGFASGDCATIGALAGCASTRAVPCIPAIAHAA